MRRRLLALGQLLGLVAAATALKAPGLRCYAGAADLVEALNSIFDSRVPPRWLAKSWKSPNLGLWFNNGLVRRTKEPTDWRSKPNPDPNPNPNLFKLSDSKDVDFSDAPMPTPHVA